MEKETEEKITPFDFEKFLPEGYLNNNDIRSEEFK